MRTHGGFLGSSVLLNLFLLCLTEVRDQNFIIEFNTYLTNGNNAMFEATSVIDCARTCLTSITCQYAAFNNQAKTCVLPNDNAYDAGIHALGWMFIKATVPVACTDCVRFGSSWYKILTDLVKMEDAQYLCGNHGGKLVEVETELENNFLKDQFTALNVAQMGFWMGAYSNNLDSSFQWNTNPNVSISYKDFHPGEPNNPGTENCLAFYRPLYYRWVDYGCKAKLYYVCELSV